MATKPCIQLQGLVISLFSPYLHLTTFDFTLHHHQAIFMKTIVALGSCVSGDTMKIANHSSTGPPLTAIDRFLYGQHSHYPQKKESQNVDDDHLLANVSTYNFLWSNNSTQESNVVDHLLANEDVLNWTQQMCIENEDVNVLGKGAKVVGAKPRKVSSMSLIKGQWTDEEDRFSIYEIKQNCLLFDFVSACVSVCVFL